ncbi:MAG: murein biosynthesis integral membrane protein MurJ [Sandaracinaceae bacterium]
MSDDAPDPDPTAEKRSGTIAKRAGIVAAGTLLSRALGFARDMVFAAVFPTGATDLFFVAFTIPNALRVLLGEGAVSAAVVPVFSEVRKTEGEEAARRYFAAFTGLMGLVLMTVSVVGVLAAPALVSVYATGYIDEPELFDQTVLLTRILFPYIFFIGLAALGIGGLNALGRFFVPSFAPTLLNVALIVGAFTLVGPAVGLGWPPIAALALAALVGGVAQWLIQWPSQRSAGLLRWPRFTLSDPAVKKSLRLMVPLLAGFGIYQLNTVLGRSLATFLPTGSQSYLYYGQRLVEIPQGMFALAIAAAALPTLSNLRAEGDEDAVREVFGDALRFTLFLAIPSTVGLAVLAEPIMTVGFGRGEFDGVAEAARSLRWQALGVWAIASVRTVVPMFFAYNDTRSPVLASGVNLVVFGVTAVTMMGPFQHVGIAMALSAAGIAQLATLLFLLRRKVGRLGLTAVVSSAGRGLAASLLMGLVAYGIALLGDWSTGGNDPRNIAILAAAVIGGALTFALFAKLFRSPELEQFVRGVRRRLGR